MVFAAGENALGVVADGEDLVLPVGQHVDLLGVWRRSRCPPRSSSCRPKRGSLRARRRRRRTTAQRNLSRARTSLRSPFGPLQRRGWTHPGVGMAPATAELGGMTTRTLDPDPQETQDGSKRWTASLAHEGPRRAQASRRAHSSSARRPAARRVELGVQTPYVNTIPPSHNADARQRRARNAHPPLHPLERDGDGRSGRTKIPRNSGDTSPVSLRRRRCTTSGSITFSARRGRLRRRPGLLSGALRAGVYARAFLGGPHQRRATVDFRQEVDGKGLSSYPHSWLMPDFWQFATVSMGLGPIQADLSSPLHEVSARSRHRGYRRGRKVWAFLGRRRSRRARIAGRDLA